MGTYSQQVINSLMDNVIGTDTLQVPTEYKKQIIAVDKLFANDHTGLIDTMLDFYINSAVVDFDIVSDKTNMTKILKLWFSNINNNVRSTVPVGIKALAKQYFIERWKGSSMMLLKCNWEDVDYGKLGKLKMPSQLWFTPGKNITIKNPGKEVELGKEVFYVDSEPCRNDSSRSFYVQRPFNKWFDGYPTPFIIRRGLFANAKFLKLLTDKSYNIITKSVDYFLLLKKGTEGLAKQNNVNYTYSSTELKEIKDLLNKINNVKPNAEDIQTVQDYFDSKKTVPVYATNFDTEIDQILPDFSKVINGSVIGPMERKILYGLGLVELVEGTSTTRKESILNPKPMIAEVLNGIEDFKNLMLDVVTDITLKNTDRKRIARSNITITNNNPTEFITKEVREHFRSSYDRGLLSKKTYLQLCGHNIEQEIVSRTKEHDDNLQETLYPPIVRNDRSVEEIKVVKEGDKDENIPEDKKGIEKRNYATEIKEEPKFDLSNVKGIFNKSYADSIKYGESEDSAVTIAWKVIETLQDKDEVDKIFKPTESLEKNNKALDKLSNKVNNNYELIDEIYNKQMAFDKIYNSK